MAKDEYFGTLKESTGFRILIYLICLLVCSMIGVAVTFFIGADSAMKLKISQAISSTLIFIVPPVMLYAFTRTKPLREIGFNKISNGWLLLAGMVLMFIALPVINQLTEWNEGMKLGSAFSMFEEMLKAMEDEAARLTEEMLNVTTIGGLITNLVVIALIPAIGEELTFRSVLQQFLVKVCKNAHVGIILAAAIFSAIHFQFYGFLPRMLLGIFLGYSFYCTKSIWTPIIMHFLNNGTAVVVYYLNNKGIINADADTFGSTDNVWLLVGSALLVVALLLFMWRKRAKE